MDEKEEKLIKRRLHPELTNDELGELGRKIIDVCKNLDWEESVTPYGAVGILARILDDRKLQLAKFPKLIESQDPNELGRSKYHKHIDDCGDFRDALQWGLVRIIAGEIMVYGELPHGTKVGNLLDAKIKKRPEDFRMGYLITHCPFCGLKLFQLREKTQETPEVDNGWGLREELD